MKIPTRSLVTGAVVMLGTVSLASEKETPPPPRPGCARVAAAGAERLGPDQQEAIAEALQDEYEGEAIYAGVLEDLGEIRPFSRVVHAEQRHAAFLEDLLKARGLAVPDNLSAAADTPTYASRQEACAAAVEFEVRNVALYDRLLATEALPDDVAQVFAHNRRASLEHHQPAFERCAGTTGGGAAVAGGAGRHGGGQGKGRMAGGPGGCGRCAGGGKGQGHGQCRRGGGPTASAPAESGS